MRTTHSRTPSSCSTRYPSRRASHVQNCCSSAARTQMRSPSSKACSPQTTLMLRAGTSWAGPGGYLPNAKKTGTSLLPNLVKTFSSWSGRIWRGMREIAWKPVRRWVIFLVGEWTRCHQNLVAAHFSRVLGHTAARTCQGTYWNIGFTWHPAVSCGRG